MSLYFQEIVHTKFGTPKRTLLDHSYSVGNAKTCGMQTDESMISPATCSLEQSHQSVEHVVPQSTESPFSEQSDSDISFSGIESFKDPDYSPTSESDSTSSDDRPHDHCQMRKFIVFEENIRELLRFCKECGSPVTSLSSFEVGSMVGFKVSCHSGHSYVWHSQPLINKQPVGNLLIAASIMFSGSTYSHVSTFARILNLSIFSKTIYNKIQKNHLLPVIKDTWKEEQKKAIVKVKDSTKVILAGDGRCDSPGYSAKYGSYTLMHCDGQSIQGTRLIVALNLVQVSEVNIQHFHVS